MNIYGKIAEGKATYEDINHFTVKVGELLSETFLEEVSSEVLPDGRMYYNIANRVIPQSFWDNYNLVTQAAKSVQESLNQKAGIGMQFIKPEFDMDKMNGIVNRIASETNYDDIKWILNEPVVNFTQSIGDNCVKKNAEFQYKSGLYPKIVRRAARKCCKWCSRLAGDYEYPDVPKDVYRRHSNCRCTVSYDPGNGSKKRQDVWSKQWTDVENHGKIEERKQIGEQKLAVDIAKYTGKLASYTPGELKKAFEDDGYEVKTLMKGNFKGIEFENGGGFKVNFEDGGLLQYHPEKRSHHDGAYYKISTGKGGIHHFEIDGTEKKK